MGTVLKGVLIGLVMFVLLVAGGVGYIQYALPDVGPAPEISVAATPERIERGRYLAEHVMSCLGCHSDPMVDRAGHPPKRGREWLGGFRWGPEDGFPGTVYSKNLTPHNLGDWSDGEIFRAITVGVDRRGEPISLNMPYDLYAKADPRDVEAVIAFLRTLPAVPTETARAEYQFPVNLLVRAFPAELPPGRRSAPEDGPAHGEYLTTLAACVHCHTRFEGGEYIGPEFAGGREFPMPGFGLVRSANITPDRDTGIGEWRRQDFIARFKASSLAAARTTKLRPGDAGTVMPWWEYAGMTERDLGAIYDFLMTLPPVRNEVVTFEPSAR
ncbi:MAG: cytochrome c [Alphaproteobacteria bacterium]|jgi:hypothetical protein|nr:cytochrome c [Alphaproteobacteria bacterium]MDP6815102.1 cytochrome c [Alphaproteobacteria bacterium]